MVDDRLIPDEIRTWVGPFSDKELYIKSGRETFNDLVKYGKLERNSTVLDAGCGCGRLTIHLLDYLARDARYEGFDICPEHIEWCKNNIEKDYSNFKFMHLDIRKDAYNPNGKYRVIETRLPYGDNNFDFIIAHSLFTHMISNEFDHYISEFSRVLKRNGILYASYYLLNENSENGIRNKTSCLNFRFKIDDCYTFDEKNPEEGIAQIELYVKEIYNSFDLEIIEPVYYSNWFRTGEFTQDFIIARKN